jgi:hypothetical protein
MDSENSRKDNCNAKPAAWEIVSVEIDALVPIRESDLEATKAWDGLVFDDADTV